MDGGNGARLLVVSAPSFVRKRVRGSCAPGSLKNHGAEQEVSNMFEMGAETMRMPLDEKMKYEQGDEGMSFGCAALVVFRDVIGG